jgi:hypothetical protein
MDRVRQLLTRTRLLHSDVAKRLQRAGLTPGGMHEIPEGNDVRLAFGYIEDTPGGGVRQRYIETVITAGEFASLGRDVRRKVLEQVDAGLQGAVHG